MTTFFTADNHYGHRNIIRLCNRPFLNLTEMDETMIANHNSIVDHDDEVYNLGDFTLGNFKLFERYARRLNGKLYIVPGGHDYRWLEANKKTRTRSGHEVVVLPPLYSLEINVGEKHPLIIVLCHYALAVWDRSHYGAIHLHGHSHGNLPAIERRMDVGVDCWQFRPISLNTVTERCMDNV